MNDSTGYRVYHAQATRSPVGGLSGGFDFFWVMGTKIDRLWPKVTTQCGGQFFKWGVSKRPTGQFLFLLGG
jgi:hypothetical protein